MRAKRCEGDPLPRCPLSGYALQRPADPHGARNQQVRENNDASIPLHTWQGLRASARIKVPGGASDFFFFFWPGKKISTLSTPFSPKKVCKGCEVCSTLFTSPLSFRELHPPSPLPAPFIGSRYRSPPGGPPCAATLGRPCFCFRPDARGAG